jgi:tetratricopeptide (TPR) repeat protein/ribosomal protein S18 acetylase RimI-like enzyme
MPELLVYGKAETPESMHAYTVESPRGTVRLRSEGEDDAAFRFALFCDSRPEWAMLPLQGEARMRLLRQQFEAQTGSYRAQWPNANRDIIELDGEPIGRVVISRAREGLRLIDIALLPAHRSRGIGTAIVSGLIGEARIAGLPLKLDVAASNAAALRFYRRLGFAVVASAPPYIQLDWRAEVVSDPAQQLADPTPEDSQPAVGALPGLSLASGIEPSPQPFAAEPSPDPAAGAEVGRLNRLACAAAAAGNYPAAIALFEQVVALAPKLWAAHFNLAISYLAAKRNDAGERHLRRTLALNPRCLPAWMRLAGVLSEQGRSQHALACYDKAIELQPDNVVALSNAGLLLRRMGQFAAAKIMLARAFELAPDDPRTKFNVVILDDTMAGRREAIESCRQCLDKDPASAGLLSNLGLCHQMVDEFDMAMTLFGRAIAANPEFTEARFNRALLRLARGDFAEGWREYEQRWHVPYMEKPGIAAPLWDGEPLDGRTILLYAEQGFGDAIQFLRYVPRVMACGGRVVLRLHRLLVRLAASLPGELSIVASNNRLPEFDAWCPLLSLPRLFDTRLESIPVDVPYLAVRPALAERWRRRLAALPGWRIGLVWAGDPRHINDFRRSLELDRLAPLFRVPGINWVSLQTGPRAGDAAMLAAAPMLDLSAELTDFAETAGVIANLDLVIAADTAVAHLAGALAAPVWTLLPHSPDWRWLLARDDSPWYPTMRLFRQPVPGDWDAVIAKVQAALAELTGDALPEPDAA